MMSFFKRTKRNHVPESGISKEKPNKMVITGEMRLKSFLPVLEGLPKENRQVFVEALLSALARQHEIMQGAFFQLEKEEGKSLLRFLAGYACNGQYTRELTFEMGEGLPGQVMQDGEMLNLINVPEGYLSIKTGLGEAKPSSLLLIPVGAGEHAFGIFEMASFKNFNQSDVDFFYELSLVLPDYFESLNETDAQEQ